MKNLYFCFILFSVLCLQSCETYGPASRYQTTRFMERPFYEGRDTSNYYVSARYGNGKIYQTQDDNRVGALNVHYSWMGGSAKMPFYATPCRIHASIGAFSQIGEYKIKDSLRLGHHTFGLRGEIGLHFFINGGKTDFNMFNFTLSKSYENGQFHDYRNKLDKPLIDPNYEPQNWSTDLGWSLGVRHQLGKYNVGGLQCGLAWNFNNSIVPYYYVDASMQLHKRLHVNVNLTSPLSKKELSSSSSTFRYILSLGVAYGF
jgi:hypothetical protein